MSIMQRRSSLPINLLLTGASNTSSTITELNDSVLTPIDHLEFLLKDMNDFCEYGNEILTSLKQTRTLSNEPIKYLY